MITGLCSSWKGKRRPTLGRRHGRAWAARVAAPRVVLCVWLAIGVVGSMAGCRESPTEDQSSGAGRPIVAVTIFPIGDIARALAGPAAEVVVVLPPGASPATFEPAPDLIRRLTKAGLVVAVGAGADDWGSDLARASGAQLVVLTREMTLRYGDNPHVWLDPILVRDEILPQVTEGLIRVVPDAEESIRRRVLEYSASLTALDDEIRAALSTVRSRAFVAAHPAWPYFAERYDLRQVGVLYPAPGREVGPRELAVLVDEARGAGVRGR